MSLKSTVGAKNTAQKLFIPKSFWRCRNFCPDRGGAGRGGAAPSFSGAGRGIVENWPGAAIFAGARVGHSEGESLCGGRKRVGTAGLRPQTRPQAGVAPLSRNGVGRGGVWQGVHSWCITFLDIAQKRNRFVYQI